MAKKRQNATPEELLDQALVPVNEWPYRVPENWVWTRIENVAELLNGYAFKSNLYTSTGIRIIRISNVQDGYIEDDKPVYYPEDLRNAVENYMLKESDLLVSLTGNVGRVALLSQAMLPAALNQRVACLRQRDSRIILNEYLYYCLLRKDFITACVKSSKGTAQLNMSTEWLKKYEIPLPPLAEQQRIVDRIVSLFEKLDQAKEFIQDALDSFENRKVAILHKAFSGELTAKWRMDNIVRVNSILEDVKNYYINHQYSKHIKSVTEFNDCAFVLKNIENSIWLATKIGAIGAVSNGSTPSRGRTEFWNGDIPWISSGEVRNNIIETSKERITDLGYENTSVKKLAPGTVLIAMIGEGKTRGQSAVIAIEATINQNIAAIDMSHKFVNPKFVWYWLQKKYRENREEGSGTGPQALNCQRVRELDFVLPPLIEQNEIVKILDQILEKEKDAYVLYDVAEEIELMKKSIINRAFRCELGTNNPDEESTKALIKSIVAVDMTTLHSKRGITKDNNASILTKENAYMAKNIIEVLREQKSLTPEKLKSLTGIIDIDEFYAELKKLVDIGEVVEIRQGDESFLEVNYADRQA